MDYRKSPIVHVPMSLIIQMPELRVGERMLLVAGARGIHVQAGSRGSAPDCHLALAIVNVFAPNGPAKLCVPWFPNTHDA